MSHNLMPLSAVALSLKVTKSKLAYYKRLGLIRPTTEFPELNQAWYDIKEVEQMLKNITKMRKRGYQLKDMVHKAV